jgi:septum formation protein
MVGGRSRFVLASSSPRRHAILMEAGVAFDIDAPDVNEHRRADERPDQYVERVARDKAAAVALRHPDRVVVAADTVVVIGDRVLGKPADASEAIRMLEALSGRDHQVLTAVAVVAPGGRRSIVDRTTVRLRHLSASEITDYVATGEPLDKAGAYAIQGGAGRFVEHLEGRLDTVIGLPLASALELVDALGRP